MRRHRPVDEVEVQVVELQAVQALAKGALGPLVAMARVPALGGDEDLAAVQPRRAHGLPDPRLVLVGGGGVDVAVPRIERLSHDLGRVVGRDLKDAEAELGDLNAARQGNAGDLAEGRSHGKAMPAVTWVKHARRAWVAGIGSGRWRRAESAWRWPPQTAARCARRCSPPPARALTPAWSSCTSRSGSTTTFAASPGASPTPATWR